MQRSSLVTTGIIIFGLLMAPLAFAALPSTLRRAVVNLMQNALEAMAHGETLTLAGQGTAREVRLEVRDTGRVRINALDPC